jgi:Na+/melibiose symporter-like transporter
MPGEIAALRALRASLGAGGFLLLVVAGVLLVLLIVRSLRRRGRAGSRAVALFLVVSALVVSLAGIAELTLFGQEGLGARPRLELDPVLGAQGWSGIAWRPVIDNVTLFVPFGAALAALWCRRSWVTLLGVTALLSIGVELFQWSFPTGRIANSADVLANLAGAALGVMLARILAVCDRAAGASIDRG